METKIIKPRLRTMGRVARASAVGMGLALVSGASASAASTTTANRCIITHERYQQLGTIDADADGELCGEYGTQVELDVYRNGVLVANHLGVASHRTTGTTAPPRNPLCGAPTGIRRRPSPAAKGIHGQRPRTLTSIAAPAPTSRRRHPSRPDHLITRAQTTTVADLLADALV